MQVVLRPTIRSIVDGGVVVKPGKRVEFTKDCELELTDEKDIELLKSKQFYGIDYFEVKTDTDKVLKEVAEAMKAKKEEKKEADDKEEKEVLSYREFQKKYYAETEGANVKDFTKAWAEYKKENGIIK